MRRAAQKMRMPPASMRTVWYAEAAMWLSEEAGMLFLLIKDNMYNLYIISIRYDVSYDESLLSLSLQRCYISIVEHVKMPNEHRADSHDMYLECK